MRDDSIRMALEEAVYRALEADVSAADIKAEVEAAIESFEAA